MARDNYCRTSLRLWRWQKELPSRVLEMPPGVRRAPAPAQLPCAVLPVVRCVLFADPWREVEAKVTGQR